MAITERYLRRSATCTKAKSKKYFHKKPIVKNYEIWRYVCKCNVSGSFYSFRKSIQFQLLKFGSLQLENQELSYFQILSFLSANIDSARFIIEPSDNSCETHPVETPKVDCPNDFEFSLNLKATATASPELAV